MMRAAREVWEAAGYHVVGGTLAGKAAEGLEKEAGIASRTLASWELAWGKGRLILDNRTVFVLDEAGMVASRQMAAFVEAVSRAGAKLILVGDAEQLQPIEPAQRSARWSIASAMPSLRRSTAKTPNGCVTLRSISRVAGWAKRSQRIAITGTSWGPS